MEILSAKWQPKGKRDRTKCAGAWVCSKCGQRLATAVLGFQPPTRVCGMQSPEIVLVLPSDIDRKSQGGESVWSSPFQFGAGEHFGRTNRHAARLECGAGEKKVHQFHLRELESGEKESRDFSVEETVKHYKQELQQIARQRAPLAPLHLVNEQLPATFQCARPGCGCISRIEKMAPPEVFARIEKLGVVVEPVVEGKSLFGHHGSERKLAKDVFFD